MSKETDEQALSRKKEIENQLMVLEKESKTLRDQWQVAKGSVNEINQLKKEIESARVQMEDFERKANYEKASEIKFGKMPKLQHRLRE